MLDFAIGIVLAVASGQADSSRSSSAGPSALSGIWSLGETRDCATGPAWVFLADGYYAEVSLPNEGSFATGLWRDEGGAIAYTHSHMPFPDMMKANEMKRLTVFERSADKLVTRNYRGVARVFHRRPAGSLTASAGQGEH